MSIDQLSLGFNIPKRVLRPDIIVKQDKELLSYIEKYGPQMLSDWIFKYDVERDLFPNYYRYMIGRCLRKFDLGFQVSTKDYTGKKELRTFALLSTSAIDSLEISIDLIIGEPEDYPILLRNIILQYNRSDHYNIYTCIPDNPIFIRIFVDAGFESEGEFYGGFKKIRLRYIKFVYKLSPRDFIYPSNEN